MQINLAVNGELHTVEEFPPIHLLLMGETGSGKSTMLRTFPKPQLVWFFDPLGKDRPYLKGAVNVGEMKSFQHGKYRDVEHLDGLVRLEYYHDLSPYKPDAYSKYLERMGNFHNEYDHWKTVGLDSATFMELSGRKWHQYVLNPTAKDARQWYGGSKELLEEMLMMRFAGLPMNVVVLTHIDEDKDELYGEIVRNPAVPGKLSKRLGSAFGEHYRMRVKRDEQGKLIREVQTENDGVYAAQSQIGAPDPSWPHYLSLWENYGKEGANA